MHRLFVAIRPPAPVRAQLLAMMAGIAGARWQSEDQLHLTLRFIGEVERPVAEDVAAALASIHHPSFTIALDGVGSFERRGKGALWLGATPEHDLQALHKKVDQACQRVGLAPEGRAYRPHVTIARLDRSTGPIDAFVRAAGGERSAPFTVDSFRLYESDLTPQGPVYSIVEVYPLAAVRT